MKVYIMFRNYVNPDSGYPETDIEEVYLNEQLASNACQYRNKNMSNVERKLYTEYYYQEYDVQEKLSR